VLNLSVLICCIYIVHVFMYIVFHWCSASYWLWTLVFYHILPFKKRWQSNIY